MSQENLNQFGDTPDEAALYARAARSRLYPASKALRSKKGKRGAAAGVMATVVALGATMLLTDGESTKKTIATELPISTAPLAPGTSYATDMPPISDVTSAGPRDPQSVIEIRGKFSVKSEAYNCEQLIGRLAGINAACSAEEQFVFDTNKPGLEAVTNSPTIFASFPAGYKPVDRVAAALGVCVDFYRGLNQSDVVQNTLKWYPFNEFSAEQLVSNIGRVACPDYKN